MVSWADRIDRYLLGGMRHWSVPVLRVALGIVFLWFGALKVFGVSPVADLVAETYHFFPQPAFLLILGFWEVVIGVLLIGRVTLRFALILLWLQMLGTLLAPAFAPRIFFLDGNPLLLTTEGEFVVKNFVLIAASLVIGGHELKPRR